MQKKTTRRFHAGFTIEHDGPEIDVKKTQRALKRALKLILVRHGTVTHASLSESINEAKD